MARDATENTPRTFVRKARIIVQGHRETQTEDENVRAKVPHAWQLKMVLSVTVNQRWSPLVAGVSTACLSALTRGSQVLVKPPHFLVQPPCAGVDEYWRLHEALHGRRSPALWVEERDARLSEMVFELINTESTVSCCLRRCEGAANVWRMLTCFKCNHTCRSHGDEVC